MSSSEDFLMRLAVGQSGGPESATFRIWSPRGKSDVYASVRDITGACKVSMHESGVCLAGLTSPFAAKERDAIVAMGGSRHQSRWIRQTHTGARIVTPLQFAVPNSEMRVWRQTLARERGVKWINRPAPERSVIVSCVFSGQELDDMRWPGRDHDTQVAGSKRLPNGEKFWLLWQDCPTSDHERIMLLEARARIATSNAVPFSSADRSVAASRVLIFKEFPADRLLVVVDAAAA
jgi:hypothetical protein